MIHDASIKRAYDQQGFTLLKGFYSTKELVKAHDVIMAFHEIWKTQNREFYQSRAVNSAYLTGTDILDSKQRQVLFQLIASRKLMALVKQLIPEQACFMNTQLFFNPFNPKLTNYWHRDSQYHLSVEEQQQALCGPEVLHFRVALEDEPGLEFVPASHKHWDSEEEFTIRLEKDGHRNYEDLSTGFAVPMNKGDLLIFSANIIHRGLYGKERLAFDILFCDPEPSILQHARLDCLPNIEELTRFEDPSAFANTVEFMANTTQSSPR